jgi:hypothetical protein
MDLVFGFQQRKRQKRKVDREWMQKLGDRKKIKLGTGSRSM